MSAPSIPNLLSLRGSRGGSGRGPGRGRGGGHGTRGAPSGASPQHTVTIRGTDTAAALSRLSAVELGYLDDPFAKLFVQPSAGPTTRRLPIINRGTYARTAAIDTIVDRFLATTGGRRRQIVSLGAGTDTRALRLFSSVSPARRDIAYHEIDFPATCAQKLDTIRHAPQLQAVLAVTSASPAAGPGAPEFPIPGSTAPPSSSWHARSAADPTNHLFCHGLDLRSLSGSASASGSTIPELDSALPTLLLSECCLCYLTPEEAAGVVAYFTSRITDLGMVIYEPIKPDDAFGRMMVSNLAAQRIRMPTLEAYKEPRDQEQRLRDAGFDSARHMTIDTAWERWVSAEEKERVDRLEGLDEVEEWLLLAGHYIVAWAWRGSGFELPET